MPGLVPHNLRLTPDATPDLGEGIEITIDENADAIPQFEMETEDGGLLVSIDGKPIEEGPSRQPADWFDNLADGHIDDEELGRIADDLLRGIGDDITSRTDWIEDRTTGLKLLGLKIEIPGQSGSAEGAPVEGMSRVRHPLLLEAVLRFQANARSEMLPTDGPVKVRNDNVSPQQGGDLKGDELADALEDALNHYLTAVASEYYPDTDRMLLMLGFGGSAFKKVYFCPLRNRPVSESVDADDLIVNNEATDLRNARRITHRTYLKASTVKRLQLLGVYRDVALQEPGIADLDSVQLEKRSQQGIESTTNDPEDRDRLIYECYCELDIKGHEHKLKGTATGLTIPYRVTLDETSKQVLSVVRNYDKPEVGDANDLPEALPVFVKYTFVPGLGFYDIGLLHILGNTTNAVTAAWREMLDAGMFANFPGFLLADTGARQNTNIFRVPPGGAALVKTGGLPINQAAMPLPYSAQGLPALMSLVQDMVQTGQRVGGTSEQQVGEGRADAPVGSVLAQIEQAQKILNSVHKRMHTAQAEEFQLLARCFRDHPEAFLRHLKRNAAFCWDEATFQAALNDCNLVPQADPNTASHTQRILKIQGLKQLAMANPTMYDPLAIDTAAIKALGWSDPQQFFAPPQAQAAPPPQVLQAQAEMQAKLTTANARMMDAQTNAKKVSMGLGADTPTGLAPRGPSAEELQIKSMDAETKRRQVEVSARNNEVDAFNQAEDRKKDLAIERARLLAAHLSDQRQREHDHEMRDKEIVAAHLTAMARPQPASSSGGKRNGRQ